MMATEASDEYVGLLMEELGDPGVDLRAPAWTAAAVAPERPFRVAIIGAGMSGIVAALPPAAGRHRRTWCSRRTPTSAARGWRTPTRAAASTSRTTSTATRSPSATTGRSYYSPQPELHRLLPHVRRRVRHPRPHPLRHRGRRRSSFDDEHGDLDAGSCATPTATSDRSTADAVISAVGQLNRPQLPDIEGRDSFAGPSFHSARVGPRRRPHRQARRRDRHRRSAAQFIPIIAEQVAQLEVFQRTPNWLFPTPTTTTTCPTACSGC